MIFPFENSCWLLSVTSLSLLYLEVLSIIIYLLPSQGVRCVWLAFSSLILFLLALLEDTINVYFLPIIRNISWSLWLFTYYWGASQWLWLTSFTIHERIPSGFVDMCPSSLFQCYLFWSFSTEHKSFLLPTLPALSETFNLASISTKDGGK